MKIAAIALLVALCVGGGFGLGVSLLPSHGFFKTVDWHGRFHGGVIYEGSLLRGWGAPEWDGVIANDKIAVVKVRPPHEARESMHQLVIDIMAADNSKADEISVAVNDYKLGFIKGIKKDTNSQYHFLVPEAVASGAKTFYVLLESRVKRAFKMRELWLRDVGSLDNGRGHIDKCNERKVSGWAAADGVGAPVRVLVDGREISWVMPSIKRQDLARVGLPTTAGYVFEWPERLSGKHTIRVMLPNGQDLNGSPCNL